MTVPAPATVKTKRDLRFAKFVVILDALVPGGLLAWDALHHHLGVNAVNFALHTTGLLALIFLLLTLLVTPLRRLTGWNPVISFRRALGLTGFFYASVHFLIFFTLDRAFSVSSTWHEMVSRRYLLVGSAGLLLMVPLAATSTNAMVMRLGARRWKALHRLTYLVAAAGAVHYYMLVKSDVRQPLAFAAALGILLAYRVGRYLLDRRHAPKPTGIATARPGTTRAAAAAAGGATGATGVTGVSRFRSWSGELRVACIFQETPDVRTFRFTPADGGPLPFQHQPGQYLNIALNIDGKRVNRSYTIASSPTRPHSCEITVKRSAMGYASWHLHDRITAATSVKVSAPAGRFVFTGQSGDRVVLIAGGVGITPLMSMVRYLTDRCWPGQIYLAYSSKTQADLIFREELAYLESRFPNLHICQTLTREDQSSGWSGARGAITGPLLTRFVPKLIGAPIYLCGPDNMMAATRELLRGLGVPDGDVQTEAFVSPSGAVAPLPAAGSSVDAAAPSRQDSMGADPVAEAPDTGAVTRVTFQRSRQETEATAQQTILEAAEAAGVDIPFECRAGICGQCKTRLIAGQVAMDSEDALTPDEKQRGYILACQAHAIGDVAVDA